MVSRSCTVVLVNSLGWRVCGRRLKSGDSKCCLKYQNGYTRVSRRLGSHSAFSGSACRYTCRESHVSEGDDIILSAAEHHSNLVPWQLLAKRKKANLKFVEVSRRPPGAGSRLVFSLSVAVDTVIQPRPRCVQAGLLS